jgi:hypothetical protein
MFGNRGAFCILFLKFHAEFLRILTLVVLACSPWFKSHFSFEVLVRFTSTSRVVLLSVPSGSDLLVFMGDDAVGLLTFDFD